MNSVPVYPFDSDRAIGTVIEVAGTTARVNLPHAAAPGSRWHYGSRMEAGRVGEFVVIEASEFAVFGRIIAVRLPERERLAVEAELGKSMEANPIGIVQLMATVNLRDGAVEPGVPAHPRLGARCFAANPKLIQWLAQHTRRSSLPANPKLLELAVLPFSPETVIQVIPESIFGRHCAILGATGGGKSWTLARLIEQTAKHASKVLLLDATGEFHTQTGRHVLHYHLSPDAEAIARGSTEVALPYVRLTEMDLFALFQPSPQSQAPRLRAAIKSLKLAKRKPELAQDGLIKKAKRAREPIESALSEFAEQLERPAADFDISKLIG